MDPQVESGRLCAENTHRAVALAVWVVGEDDGEPRVSG